MAQPADGGPVTKQSFFENMVSTKEPTRKQWAVWRGHELLGRVTADCGFDADPRPVLQKSLFHVLEPAPCVTLPSCAVSVSGALRHGAP